MIGRDNIALAIWLAAIFAIVCLFYLVYAQAAVLTITGSAVGHGICNMTVQADIISANISQAVNCSSWQIVAGGWTA
ncbi:MAG: hypothetical protein GX874_06175 [Smithella sp.]|nr:hypothetical protein [Smithella sp.]